MYPHTPCQVPGHSGPAERRASAFPAAVPPLRAARRRFLPPQCSCRRAHCAAAPPDRAHGGRRARLRFQPDIPPPPHPPPRAAAPRTRAVNARLAEPPVLHSRSLLFPRMLLCAALWPQAARPGRPPPPPRLQRWGRGWGRVLSSPAPLPRFNTPEVRLPVTRRVTPPPFPGLWLRAPRSHLTPRPDGCVCVRCWR